MRLEGWQRVSALHPSFETIAQAGGLFQDEVLKGFTTSKWRETTESSNMTTALKLGAAVALVLLSGEAALPRSLQAIVDRGAVTLCANPDALPWASKTGAVPGFQVELAENLATRLGVSLTRQWVISAFQYRRVDCVVLAVRNESGVTSLAGLAAGHRVGVLVGSLASMRLDTRGIKTTPFVLEG